MTDTAANIELARRRAIDLVLSEHDAEQIVRVLERGGAVELSLGLQAFDDPSAQPVLWWEVP
jgi:hypothetical protein